ncbi:hypothetical protein BU15DRAFT_78016 [Melanogaster broomeanus]|nr:hypothetical protein BU15DRAFT_78016 [Melanogaster broomeanus]
MNYHAFPTQHPDDASIKKQVALTVKERLFIKPPMGGMVSVKEVCNDGKDENLVFSAPAYYADHIHNLLYRRYALALLLHHDDVVPIKSYRFWVVLAQNYEYVDARWRALEMELGDMVGMDSMWRSDQFERYLVTEAIVRRHEPVYVNKYRRHRNPEMLNVSQASIEEVDWESYQTSIAEYPLWSGQVYGSVIPETMPALDVIGDLLAQANDWYNDNDRPLIHDPYTSYWAAAKWRFKDPFDPQVTDCDVDDDSAEDDERALVDEAPWNPALLARLNMGTKSKKRDRSGSGVPEIRSPPRKRPVLSRAQAMHDQSMEV